METILVIVRYLHIASGTVALVGGLLALISKKGRSLHRSTGKIFFYSMLLVSATAIFIAIAKEISFLFFIGVFAFFMTYSGFRSVRNKSLRPTVADWLVLVIADINGILMILSLQLVLMIFGIINLFFVIGDIRIYLKILRDQPITPMRWALRHIGMMIGAYIATFTAFLVVNLTAFDPIWLPWLLPTIAGVPLIIYWSRKYRPAA